MSVHLRRIRRQRRERLGREKRAALTRRWCDEDCRHDRVAPDRTSRRMAKSPVGPGYHQEWRARCLTCGLEGWFQEAAIATGPLRTTRGFMNESLDEDAAPRARTSI